jgi:hypothetical protein
MKWLEKKTGKGILKYRMPTILEAVSFIKLMREHFSTDDHIGAKLEIMKNIKDLLDYSLLEGIKSFDELNENSEEFTSALYEISDEILVKVVNSFAKKN